MATTFAAIRAHFCGSSTGRGLVEALTPSIAASLPFQRVHRRHRLREWADGKSACFRHFEWVSDSDVEVLSQGHGQDVHFVRESALLTIAYPTSLPAMPGLEEMDSWEDVMRSDARQVRDCLFSPANLYSDLYAVIPTILEPERGALVSFQSIRVDLQFREAQTLT